MINKKITIDRNKVVIHMDFTNNATNTNMEAHIQNKDLSSLHTELCRLSLRVLEQMNKRASIREFDDSNDDDGNEFSEFREDNI